MLPDLERLAKCGRVPAPASGEGQGARSGRCGCRRLARHAYPETPVWLSVLRGSPVCGDGRFVLQKQLFDLGAQGPQEF